MKKIKKPTATQFIISFLLSLTIVFGGSAYLYRPHKGDRDIILYTTAWCPYCNALRTELKAYNIPFIERDTEKSLSGLLGFVVLGGRGVPVSVIGEEVVKGYQHDQIVSALEKLGYDINAGN